MPHRIAFCRPVVLPVLAAVGLALGAGGCRLLPSQPEPVVPELGIVDSEATPGDRVALVREAMIESAAMSEGAPHSEGAQEAVRIWRGQGAEAGGG